MSLRFVLIWMLFWSLAALILFGVDKAKARRKAWRIPEKSLFLSAFLGGAPGAIAGMFLFRHKTKHLSFRLGIPAALVLWAALIGFGLWKGWIV